METNEFRIGNYVFLHKNSIGKVTAIEQHLILINQYYVKINDTNDIYYQANQIKPIPLNEELLLKCGFVKLGDLDFFYILEYEMNFKISSDLKMIAWYNLQLHNVKIEYLHQLQNLYFALTNNELNIEL